MMHKDWSSIEEVPYCFSTSYVKLQGHTAQKIVEFDPNWAFPDCNSSLNSPMAMKCCTKLETAKERCPIVFQGHPSNFKVTRYKTSPILTQIGRFRTIGQSQLSNPSDLPCFSRPSNSLAISYMSLLFHHDPDLDLEISRSRSIALFQEWEGLLTSKERGELIIHYHKRDLCVSMAGWVDVPDNDWGDISPGYQPRRAVDIRSAHATTVECSNGKIKFVTRLDS